MPQIVNPTLQPSLAVSRTQIVLPSLVMEGTTASMSFVLQTSAGGVVANTDILTMVLTHVDKESGTVIANRYLQDVLGAPAKLGANNVTVSTTATITWAMQTGDTPLVDPLRLKALETHVAIFDVVLNTNERFIIELGYQLKRRYQPLTLS
jgi:hypothetical protein